MLVRMLKTLLNNVNVGFTCRTAAGVICDKKVLYRLVESFIMQRIRKATFLFFFFFFLERNYKLGKLFGSFVGQVLCTLLDVQLQRNNGGLRMCEQLLLVMIKSARNGPS